MATTITVYEACKKRKRTPNILTISHFASAETTMDFGGSFRENIREFLKRCSETEDYRVAGNPVWCTLLASESSGVVFPLFIVEETVISSSSPPPFCDFCRFVGWSHHFVSKRNYHFIIPEDCKWNKPLKEETLKLQAHLLHGVIHCNGFGHLLSIKTQSNLNYLQGEELMNLWDHLCSALLTCEISVNDLSKKGSMDLRLLYGVAYGRSWFGKWGYKLSRGSFGITTQDYYRAIDILSSLDLRKIISDFAKKRKGKSIEQIIQTYRDVSKTRLDTISELLKFMLVFESKPVIQRKTALAFASMPKSSAETTYQANSPLHCHSCNGQSLASFVADMNSRWPARRLKHAVKVIFQILETRGTRMLRQELRNAVREHIGDTGLIDYVLKHINKVTLGNKIVLRENKPTTKLLEFSLKDVSEEATIERETELDAHNPALQPGRNVYKDLLFLYKNVLMVYPDYHPVNIAVRILLDSKHFVKEWPFKSNSEDTLLRLMYQVRPSYDELMNELTRPMPPSMPLMAPDNATVGEVKLMVQYALRDTYILMDKFVVKDIEIGELVVKEEEELHKCGVEQGMQVWVRGYGLNLDTKVRYQGGDNDWSVDCRCRAKDDDGERMVACDVCQVWQHTRCNNIKDDDDPPPMFLCRMCSNSKKSVLAEICKNKRLVA